jgi:hypothetical protein
MGAPSWWSFRPSPTSGRPRAGSTRRTPARAAATATLCTCAPSPSELSCLVIVHTHLISKPASLLKRTHLPHYLDNLDCDLIHMLDIASGRWSALAPADLSCTNILSKPSYDLSLAGACGRTCLGATRRRSPAAAARAAATATTSLAAGESKLYCACKQLCPPVFRLHGDIAML